MNSVAIPFCSHCDQPTRRAPCESCGSEDPIGTRAQAAVANARRLAVNGIKIPEMPKGGWTAGSLGFALMHHFPADTPIRIFCPFDGEGPESWEHPHIKIENGTVRLTP